MHSPRGRARAAIDSKRSADGIFCGDLKSNVPAGQAAAADVLSACYSLISELVDTASPISAELSDTYRSLAGIRNALLQLRTARTWDDAEARHPAHPRPHTRPHPPGGVVRAQVDRKLKRYQGQLDKIDGERSARGGIFGGGKASLHHVPAGQAACAEVGAPHAPLRPAACRLLHDASCMRVPAKDRQRVTASVTRDLPTRRGRQELAECFDLVAEIQARRNGAAGGGA